uniref:SH3 domain-containing protein n=1 Tax=Panagrolaimus davidi TaxID=227884 RepID=A0A914P4V1_9BILA
MPDIPHVKRRYGTSSRPSTADSRHLSWINGSSITKFPSGAQTEILKSFIATVDDEVSVPAGSIVSAMYKDTTGQWIYVKRADNQHGYVPDFICSLLIPPPLTSDSPPPEKPKISRRKSQQIKRELKKFHKREYEKRAEQLMIQNSAFTSETSSRLPNRFGSSIGHSARFLKTASMDRLQLKQQSSNNNRRPSKGGIGSVTAATAAAICAVAADKNRRNYISPSGLVTLERAKPRRLPTAAERQFAMNENLRRFLSSLPQFPILPPDELEDSDDRPLNDTTIEQDDEDEGGKSSSRDARYAKLKSTSQMNLTEKIEDDDCDCDSDMSGLELAKKITIKMKSGKVQRQLSVSNPDFGANFGLKKTPPEPPPKPLKSAASVSRLHNSGQSHTVQRQRRVLNSAPVHSTSSLARPSCWRPAEPVIHELVAIQDFRAETKIDLHVRRGDRLTTVFSAINGWIWATHSDSKQQGFIPSSSVMLANEFS